MKKETRNMAADVATGPKGEIAHPDLIAHGEHLTRRCPGWTEDQVRRRGWAPEAA